MKAWLRAIAATAVLCLLLHGVSVLVVLLPALHGLDAEARRQLNTIGPHMRAFQFALALAVTGVGALAGALACSVLALLGRPVQPKPAMGLAAGLILLGMGREVAHRPAVFEDLLWRHGGVRAWLQVMLAERLGTRLFDGLFVLLAVGLLATVFLRLRHHPRTRFSLLASFAIVAVLIVLKGRVDRPVHVSGTPVIVIAADSLRLDHLSGRGYPKPTTPHLDALLKSGAQVTEVFAPIASTTAAWATLLTGLYPHHHGLRDLFPRAEQTHLHAALLPRLLEEKGYNTSVLSDYAGESFRRVDYGFDHIDAPPMTSLEVLSDREAIERLPFALAFLTGSIGQRIFPVGGYLPVNAAPAALSDRVEDELTRLESSGKPFFLVAFYSVTHAPFAAPMPYARQFSAESYNGPSRYAYELQQLEDLQRMGKALPAEESEQVRALYDGSLRSFDDQVGRLLARLERDGLLAQSLVLVTGDHGENLYEPGTTTEHGKWFKGASWANRTGLIGKGPMLAQSAAWPERVSGVDVMPTLLTLLQQPVPKGLDGRSFLVGAGTTPMFAETTLWLGGPDDAPPGAISYPSILQLLEVEDATHALVLKRRYQDLTVQAKLRAAMQWPYELIYLPTLKEPRWELYNLAADPWAEHNVLTEHVDVAGPLKRHLRAWLLEDPLRWPDAGDELISRVEQ